MFLPRRLRENQSSESWVQRGRRRRHSRRASWSSQGPRPTLLKGKSYRSETTTDLSVENGKLVRCGARTGTWTWYLRSVIFPSERKEKYPSSLRAGLTGEIRERSRFRRLGCTGVVGVAGLKPGRGVKLKMSRESAWERLAPNFPTGCRYSDGDGDSADGDSELHGSNSSKH